MEILRVCKPELGPVFNFVVTFAQSTLCLRQIDVQSFIVALLKFCNLKKFTLPLEFMLFPRGYQRISLEDHLLLIAIYCYFVLRVLSHFCNFGCYSVASVCVQICFMPYQASVGYKVRETSGLKCKQLVISLSDN